MTTLREDSVKGVRLRQEGRAYIVETYRPATGELLSTRTFHSVPISALRYYRRALTAASSTQHLDNSSLGNPPRFRKRR